MANREGGKMSASELKYLIATHSLSKEGIGARLTDIADKLGVTKVSVYRMSERLEAGGMMARGEHSRIFLTERGKKLLDEYMLCVDFVRNALEKCCRTPKTAAFADAVGIVCAVGEHSRSALLSYLRKKERT